MARLEPGAIGLIKGNLHNLVGSSWRGIPYVKKRTWTRRSESEKEKLNRRRFAMAHDWLQPLLPFLREGFRDHSLRSFGYNAAKSYLLKNAFEGEAPDIYINPARVKVSAGDLPLPANITAEKDGEKYIKFTWDPSNEGGSIYDDVMLLAYHVESGTVFKHIYGEKRYKGAATLQVVAGHIFHLYLAFNAADRSRRSDSVYLGEIEM